MAEGYSSWPKCRVCHQPMLVSLENRYLPLEVVTWASEAGVPEGAVQQWECQHPKHGFTWRIPLPDGSVMVVD